MNNVSNIEFYKIKIAGEIAYYAARSEEVLRAELEHILDDCSTLTRITQEQAEVAAYFPEFMKSSLLKNHPTYSLGSSGERQVKAEKLIHNLLKKHSLIYSDTT